MLSCCWCVEFEGDRKTKYRGSDSAEEPVPPKKKRESAEANEGERDTQKQKRRSKHEGRSERSDHADAKPNDTDIDAAAAEAVSSSNDWEHANLGSDDRKNKFLRLMGAAKVRISSVFFCWKQQIVTVSYLVIVTILSSCQFDLTLLLSLIYSPKLKLRLEGYRICEKQYTVSACRLGVRLCI